MNDKEQNGIKSMGLDLMFPVRINFKGFPIAVLHADGSVEGSEAAIVEMLTNMRGPPSSNGITLWMVLNLMRTRRLAS